VGEVVTADRVVLELIHELDVVPAVVLDGDSDGGVGEVQPPEEHSGRITYLEVGHWLWDAGENEKQAEPGLHRRVDPVADQSRSPAGMHRVRGAGGRAVGAQGLGGDLFLAHQPVPDDHEVHQAQHAREVEEQPVRGSDTKAQEDADVVLSEVRDVGLQSDSAPAVGVPRDGDVVQRVPRNGALTSRATLE